MPFRLGDSCLFFGRVRILAPSERDERNMLLFSSSPHVTLFLPCSDLIRSNPIGPVSLGRAVLPDARTDAERPPWTEAGISTQEGSNPTPS